MNSFEEIQKLLQDRADCQSRIKLIPYDGSPEIKENSTEDIAYVSYELIENFDTI